MAEVPDEILAKIRGFAKAQGVDIGLAPEGSDAEDLPEVVPAVSLNRSTSEIAHETGMNLRDSGLYRYGHRLVTVSEEGEIEDMDVDLFRSWIDRFQLNYYKRAKGEVDDGPGAPIRATLKKDVAAVLLRSREFTEHLPELEAVLPVALPAWDNEGNFSRLQAGYDPHSRTFTARTVDYETDWTRRKAVTYLRDLLGEFPFGDEGRSMSVQVSAMLTVFCQLLLPVRGRWPMIYYNANMEGSGKSRLAEIVIYPVYGDADTVTYAESEEFRKELDTWALQRRAYTFIDDVSGLVRSNILNKWLTMPNWSGRIMHSQRQFSVLQRSVTLLTGNQAILSGDLGRRSLVVDLWAAEIAADRQGGLSRVIDQEWLADAENRADMLAALYALVRDWAHENGGQEHDKAIPSFEAWSRLVPAIVAAAGFECPLQPADLTDAGAKQSVEFARLIQFAVKKMSKHHEKAFALRLTEWCAFAREAGLFYSIVGDYEGSRDAMDSNERLYRQPKDDLGVAMGLAEDDRVHQAYRFMDRATSTKFANMLHKHYRGRVVQVDGVRWQFADREARHSTFALTMLEGEGEGSDQDS